MNNSLRTTDRQRRTATPFETTARIGNDVASPSAVLDALGRWSIAHDDAGRAVRVRQARLIDAAACAAAQRRLSCLKACAPTKAARVYEVVVRGREIVATYQAIRLDDDLASMLAPHDALDLATFTPIASQILAAVEPMHAIETTVGLLRPADVRVGCRDGRALHVMVQDMAWISPDIDTVAHRDASLEALVAPEGIHESLASDVYALGALFGRMLTGQWPEASRVRWPRTNDIPTKLQHLVNAMLHRDPQCRPQSADAVIEALVAALPARLFALPRSSPPRPIEDPPTKRPASALSARDNPPSMPRTDSRQLVTAATTATTADKPGSKPRSAPIRAWIAGSVVLLMLIGVLALYAGPDAPPATQDTGSGRSPTVAVEADEVSDEDTRPSTSPVVADERVDPSGPAPAAVGHPGHAAPPKPDADAPASTTPSRAQPERAPRRKRRAETARGETRTPTADTRRPAKRRPTDAGAVEGPPRNVPDPAPAKPAADGVPPANEDAPTSSLFNPSSADTPGLDPDSPFLPPSR